METGKAAPQPFDSEPQRTPVGGWRWASVGIGKEATGRGEGGGEDVIAEAGALFSCSQKSLKGLRQRSEGI